MMTLYTTSMLINIHTIKRFLVFKFKQQIKPYLTHKIVNTVNKKSKSSARDSVRKGS